MNKNLYRIVFNQKTGEYTAVAETASTHGKGRSTGNAASLISALTGLFSLRFVRLAVGIAALFGSVTVVDAQVVAYRNAPGNQQPTVLQTGNGIPLVNIQTPSAQGVSRNIYSQFDVDSKGVILNNARNNALTQLGGLVQGNPWLATGTAKVIVNEVNSANPSYLRGYVEVAGDRAQVVIANPSGLLINGGGFLNATRATLTTGVPNIVGGTLDSYRVTGGTISIEGAGLDASRANYTDIMARAVQINANIWANDKDQNPNGALKVSTGVNTISADHTVVTPISGATGAAPGYAIDVARLAGMYSGKITLIGTEHGVGMNNAGAIGAGAGDVVITVDGLLQNKGSITATQSVTATATSIDNQAGAQIVATTNNLRATGSNTFTNRGLIDGVNTFIDSPTVNNLGSGRMYGDHLAVSGTTLNNQVEVVNGVVSAPVMAARQRMDLGFSTINNSEQEAAAALPAPTDGKGNVLPRPRSLIFSDGDIAVGGGLDANHRAIGSADTINNVSSTIEATNKLDITTAHLNNTDRHFDKTKDVQTVEVAREHHDEYQATGDATRYPASQVRQINDEADDMWLLDQNGNPVTNKGNDFNRYVYDKVTTEEQLKNNTEAAKLLSGSDMNLHLGTLLNETSWIIAGGALNTNGATVQNTNKDTGTRFTQSIGDAAHWYNIAQKGRDKSGTDHTPYPANPVIQSITLGVTRSQVGSVVGGSSFALPGNSLIQPAPSTAFTFLRADPQFANYRTWLSSDAMLLRLSYDPATVQKRLGDGFIEQKLLREQIAQLTGRRFLNGYSNDETQYAALMNNGATFAQQYHLIPGVALSAAQMAQLTSDIVWLEQKDVVLPDGSQVKALVPRLYVHVKTGDITGDGALLSGATVNLNTTGDIINGGTVAGRTIVNLTAENVQNLGGRITGNDVAVQANTDINNLGGTIDASHNLTAIAGRDLNNASTLRSNTSGKQDSRTNIDQIGTLAVTGDNGSLTAAAGRDINVDGAQVVNTGNNSQTTLAAMRDVNLGTATEKSDQTIAWNADNTRRDTTRTEVGSRIATVGDTRLAAGRDLTAKGANITSEQGAITATAVNDVNLTTADAQQTVDERHKSQGSNGFWSTKTITTRDTVDQTDKIGSNLSGKTVAVQAGHDANIIGSSVVATDTTNVLAGNNANIVAATGSSTSSHMRDEIKSGVFSGGGFGFTIGTQQKTDQTDNISTTQSQSRSTVGSTNGSVNVIAGNNATVAGSDAIAAQDINVIGKNVAFTPGQDQNHTVETHEFKQSGLTIALTGGMADAAQSVQQSVKRGSEVKDKRLAGLYGVKAAQTAYQSMDTAKNVMAATSADGAAQSSGIKISISVGMSQAKNTSTTDSIANAGSTATAGRNLNVVATEGDIKLQGATLDAKDILLNAKNNIDISSATDATSNRSSNSSASASVGVFLGYDSKGSKGIGFEASGSIAQGKTDSDTTADKETQVTAANKLTMITGRDTNIKGGQLRADQIKADIGGNLNIASTQDTDTYRDKQQSAAISGSIGMGSGSLSLQLSDSRTKSDYKSVQEQSGLFAGQGGYDIKVKNNTDLNGAVIASAASADKNKLSTGTLTTNDIANKADYKSQTISIGVGTGSGPGVGNVGGGPGQKLGGLGIGATSGSASGTTRSAISDGSIVITDNAGQQQKTGRDATQTVATLNRDTTNANGSIKKIFDKQAVDETLELAKLTGELGYKAAADVAQKRGDSIRQQAEAAEKAGDTAKAEQLRTQAKDWDEGGSNRAMLHAAVGAAQGGIQGGLSGAAAAAGGAVAGHLAGKAAQDSINNALGSKDKDGNTVANAGSNLVTNIISTAAGAAAGGALSGGTTTGALQGAGAGSDVDKFNRQLTHSETQKISKLAANWKALGYSSEAEAQSRLTTAACGMIKCGYDDPSKAGLQQLGESGDYQKERSTLAATNTTRGGRDFTYDYLVDGSIDTAKRYQAGTRLSGAAQGVLGTAGAAASATGCLTPVTCVLGATGTAISLDYANSGFNQAITGTTQATLGEQALQAMGLSKEAAALTYAALGLSPAAIETAMANKAATQAAALNNAAKISYTPITEFGAKGLQPTAEILKTQQAQAIVNEYVAAGAATDDALRYTQNLLRTGKELPQQINITSSTELIKIVPKTAVAGDSVGSYSPFFVTRQEYEALSKLPADQMANRLGLPAEQAVRGSQFGFDVYAMKPVSGATPKAFISEVAPVQQGQYSAQGGAQQVLVLNRSQWTDPNANKIASIKGSR